MILEPGDTVILIDTGGTGEVTAIYDFDHGRTAYGVMQQNGVEIVVEEWEIEA